MTVNKQLESYRQKIDELIHTIHHQKIYIKQYVKSSNSLKDIKTSLSLNEKKLQFETADFTNYIANASKDNLPELISWIRSHLETIKRMKTFSNYFCLEPREFTIERIEEIAKLKNDWENFLTEKKIPESLNTEDYNLFYDFGTFELNDNEKDLQIQLNKIQEIEQLRQNIGDLRKQNAFYDAALDKGSSWGVSEKEANNAATEYSRISKSIIQKDKELNILIDYLSINFPEILNLWLKYHLLTCISIVNYAYTKQSTLFDKDHVRISLTKELYYEWKELDFKNKRYIIPNTYYLKDYDMFFNSIANKIGHFKG